MLFYRPHRGGLKEAMRDLMCFESLEDFVLWYFETHNCTLFDIRKYSDSCDKRIGWDFTMIVSDNEFCKASHVQPSGWLYDNECMSFLDFCAKHDYMLLEFIRPGISHGYFK